MVSRIFSLKSALRYEPYIRVHAEVLQRKVFRVRMLRDDSEGTDGSGMIPFLVSRLHLVCIRRRQADLRLQGALTVRSVPRSEGHNGCTPPGQIPSYMTVTSGGGGCES